jgi:hypothetical protein
MVVVRRAWLALAGCAIGKRVCGLGKETTEYECLACCLRVTAVGRGRWAVFIAREAQE